MSLYRSLLLTSLLASLALSHDARAQAPRSCDANGMSLQILGSGGPFGNGRASSGYLLWIDGTSRLMVDAGGGTFARFHEAGATLADLQLMALSHFHPDHSAELPALLWPNTGTLTVAGPSGTAGFPSVAEYLDGLFGERGVFRVVDERFDFEVITVEVAAGSRQILGNDSFTVTARGVPHGDVPTVAYLVESGGASIAFSSDQTGADPAFTDFVRNVDVLVVHFAGNEDGSGRQDLHARPSVWGQIARDAGVGRVVLSHLSTNPNFEANLDHFRRVYSGPLTLAEDLMCLKLR